MTELLPQLRRVCHSKFSDGFYYSLDTSHTERQSFMYLRTQFQREKSWLSSESNHFFFHSFFQWTSARVNANQGRCINGHLSHCMRRRLNVMLNCLSCALGWSLHYVALGGLLQDLRDSFDSYCERWKQRWGVYWSGIWGNKMEGCIKITCTFTVIYINYLFLLIWWLILCFWWRFLKVSVTFCTHFFWI